MTGKGTVAGLVAASIALIFLAACDSITRHKVLTTVFDGVPDLPPPEEYCVNFQSERAELISSEALLVKPDGAPGQQSKHKPYAENQCEACHDFDTDTGLRVASTKLCFECHFDFIQGRKVHGPVAAGSCLSCHLPHSSEHASLLKMPKNVLCSGCHREQRLTPGMHEAVSARQMSCPDCHDPHFGDQSFFLK